MRARARIARFEQIAARRSAARVEHALASGELAGLTDAELGELLRLQLEALDGGVVLEFMRASIADAESAADRRIFEQAVAWLEAGRPLAALF